MFNFKPKIGLRVKKVITSAGKVFQTTCELLKCASGSLSDQRVRGLPSLHYANKCASLLLKTDNKFLFSEGVVC